MKHIFFDIDGTLVGATKKVTPNTKKAIKQTQAKGNKVYLCTGRAPCSITSDILNIGFDGIVASAGGFISIEDTCIFNNTLDKTILKQVMVLFTNKKVLFTLETEKALYQTPGVADFFDRKHAAVLKDNPELQRFFEMRKNEEMRRPIHEFSIDKHDVFKICFIAQDKLAFYDCVKYLAEKFHVVTFSKKEDDFINGEIIDKGCTKGNAIYRVLKHFDANVEDSIAFGDSMNDFQMIEAAGHGVVFHEAPEKLKVIADDYFDDPDQDGIYRSMKKLNLI